MRSFLLPLFLLQVVCCTAQTIARIDGSVLHADSLEKKIRDLMKAAGVTGMAVCVYNENKPVFLRTFGMANAREGIPWKKESVIYAASFSKLVFAYTVMQLVQEGSLDLDKPLAEYLDKPLPEYKFTSSRRGYQQLADDPRYKLITARMCLTHTTGFPNWRWFEDDQQLKFLFDPGTRYRYSGEGLYLVQFVIEKITGKDYETISRERVFKPLAMHNSSQVWQSRFDAKICYGHNAAGRPYPVNKWAEPNAAGSLSTTFADFIKFYTGFINGVGLDSSLWLQMTSTQVPIRSQRQFGPMSMVDGDQNDNIRLGYGFGIGVLHSPFGRAYFKEGNDDGWQHYCISYPDKKTAIVIFTNSDNGDSIFRELLSYSIGDVYTPWQWENYIPFDQKIK